MESRRRCCESVACLRPAAQRGGISLLLAFGLCFATGVALIALVSSRLNNSRLVLQHTADSLALAAAHSLSHYGATPLRTDFLHPTFGWLNTPQIYDSAFVVEPTQQRQAQHRAVVGVTLRWEFDSEQSWFPRRLFDIVVSSRAQVNEQIFAEEWPVVVFVLDTSLSMNEPILGGTPTAYKVMSDIIKRYAGNTFPVRNGLIMFDDERPIPAHKVVPPPLSKQSKQSNRTAIGHALDNGQPSGQTDTAQALERVRQVLMGYADQPRNVILITDGEPTRALGCAPQSQCCFDKAKTAASQLRYLPPAPTPERPGGVSLFTIEIRRHNYSPQLSQLLVDAAGGPYTEGGDKRMHYLVQTVMGMTGFMVRLAEAICAFGPLEPTPGDGPDAYRMRASNPAPDPTPGIQPWMGDGRPQRIFAFLRDETGKEMPIPILQDRATSGHGFQYVVDQNGDSKVVLTLDSCNWLGQSGDRRLVVRWDDPQLSPL